MDSTIYKTLTAYQIDLMLDYGKRLIKTPYVWGGDKPTIGLDCSGLVLELLKAIGVIGRKELDMTAQGIYAFISSTPGGRDEVDKGDLIFFGTSLSKISHIAIAIDSNYMLEAGGEGSVANDEGMVRIRPINWRSDFLVCKAIQRK